MKNWEALKKGLNCQVNKANVRNLRAVIRDLFKLNLHRGRGLLARYILRAQAAAPSYSNVYAALVAVVGSKLPDVAKPLIHRLLGSFQRQFDRGNLA